MAGFRRIYPYRGCYNEPCDAPRLAYCASLSQMSRKCPGYVPVKPDSRESMQGLSPRGGRSGSRLGFASRATPCTASAFVLILRTHTRCKSRNPYKARRTAAEFARWSAWSCPRRMSASISRSRNSMPRNRNPLRRRSRCRSIRAADDERGSSFVAGDKLYCAWIMIHRCTRSRERNLLPLYEQKITKSRGGGHRIE
jgi:hypothetical protein